MLKQVRILKKLEKYFPASQFGRLLTSKKQAIELAMKPATKDLPLIASRVGGIGYWPENRDYPHNTKGQPLALLAQLNLAEMPAHPQLPQQGILAFYIDVLNNTENDTATVYFPDVSIPSMTKEAQRALFPEYAFFEGLDIGDFEGEYTDTIKFKERWAADPKAEIQRWLTRQLIVVSVIDDHELQQAWQQEYELVMADMEKLLQQDNISGLNSVLFPYFKKTTDQINVLDEKEIFKIILGYWNLGDNWGRIDFIKFMLNVSAEELMDEPEKTDEYQRAQKIFSMIEETIEKKVLEDNETSREARNLLLNFIDKNDQEIELIEDEELSFFWDLDKQYLLSQVNKINNLNDVQDLMNFCNKSDSRFYELQQKKNPHKAFIRFWKSQKGKYVNQKYGKTWDHPVSGEYAISGSLKQHYLIHDSFEFEQLYGSSLYTWEEKYEVDVDAFSEIYHAYQSTNHILGYPYFTDDDPRNCRLDKQQDILLFQLDSSEDDKEVKIKWKNYGLGNFFISPDDLQNQRFEKAWFNWDVVF